MAPTNTVETKLEMIYIKEGCLEEALKVLYSSVATRIVGVSYDAGLQRWDVAVQAGDTAADDAITKSAVHLLYGRGFVDQKTTIPC